MRIKFATNFEVLACIDQLPSAKSHLNALVTLKLRCRAAQRSKELSDVEALWASADLQKNINRRPRVTCTC